MGVDNVHARRYLALMTNTTPDSIHTELAEMTRPHKRCPGWHRMGDSDYDCGGCRGCRMWVRLLGNVVKAAELTASAPRRQVLEDALGAANALVAIGAAVAAALAPGLAVATFLADTIAAYNEVHKGRWYRVAAKRGKNVPLNGKVGQVKWIGESHYGGTYYGRSARYMGGRTVERIGLAIEGHEKLVYVGATQLEPVAEPASARETRETKERERATKAVRQSAASRGTKVDVLVLAGAKKGSVGKIFWVRLDGSKIGVKFCACKKRCSCEVAWLGAHDALLPASSAITYEHAEAALLGLAEAGIDSEWADAYEARARELLAQERA